MRLRSRVKQKNNPQNKNGQNSQNTKGQENFSLKLKMNLKENLNNLKKMLDEPDDLVIREFTVAGMTCAVVYIDGITDSDFIHTYIMKDLQGAIDNKQQLPTGSQALFEFMEKEVISATAIERGKTMDDVSNKLLSGCTIVYLDGVSEVFIINTIGGETRSIQTPETEPVLRGPKGGFVENIQTNKVLIRRQIKDPNLRFKTHQVGRRAKKSLVVAYIDGIVNPKIVKEVNRRLKTIDMDEAVDSGLIEQWIQDSFLSPFPQLMESERPDKVVAALMEGKVAILVDGTPFVLILPVTLSNTMQSPEDYYQGWMIGSLIRILRYIAAFIAIFVPALYVALTSYHPGLIPSDIAFSIAASREGVPFNSIIEALMMVTTMELLREAGTRLPSTIGQTIGIVGGLVIGEAAVSAGIVSPIMVIVVALNAIASFAIPQYAMGISFRILMFAFLIAAGVFGLYGIILVYIMINIHIVNLKSFGIPYSTQFAPGFLSDWKDIVLRAPAQVLKRKRPVYLQTRDDKLDQGGNQQ